MHVQVWVTSLEKSTWPGESIKLTRYCLFPVGVLFGNYCKWVLHAENAIQLLSRKKLTGNFIWAVAKEKANQENAIYSTQQVPGYCLIKKSTKLNVCSIFWPFASKKRIIASVYERNLAPNTRNGTTKLIFPNNQCIHKLIQSSAFSTISSTNVPKCT